MSISSFPAINKCDPNPCKNGATCQQLSDEQYVCICPPSFKGTLCTGEIRELKQRRQQRERKRHPNSEFALFQTLSLLFQHF